MRQTFWGVGAAMILAGCAAPPPAGLGPAEDLDHANPYVLNELAVASAQRGDVASAALLLERAARLAPDDTRIARNLDTVRAARTGVPPLRKPAAAPASAAPQPQPAIWPSP
jgi:Flp pilus assembly protein TadD